MRHRQAHEADKESHGDPLRIFESPELASGHQLKPAIRRVPKSTAKQCNWMAPRFWLFLFWAATCAIMMISAWKMYALLQTPDQIRSEAMFFKTLLYFLPSSTISPTKRKARQKREKLKYILYLNNYWNLPDFQFGEGQQPFVDAQCPVSKCYATGDPSILSGRHSYANDRSAFDAVMIHAPEFNFHHRPDIREWRRPEQRFVYVNMESPRGYPAPDDITMNFFYNWTMTYRSDSDIPRPYGFFQPISKTKPNQKYFPTQFESQDFLPYEEEKFMTEVLPSKDDNFFRLATRRKKVAWIVSRCYSPSRREDYVANLKYFIDVDVYGKCGEIACDRPFGQHPNKDNCTLAVEHDYKFYLSFENSYCRDYVTEKFFKRIKEDSLVVVLGGANYSRVAPPHSHLNALDYDSPKALADKIRELDRNDSQYLSYFWWKDHYAAHNGTAADHASSMCRLCEMLHDSALPRKSYPSVAAWHGDKTQCWKKFPRVIQKFLPRFGPLDADESGESFDGQDDHI